MKPEIQEVIERLYAVQVENYRKGYLGCLLGELRHTLYQAHKSVERKTNSTHVKPEELQTSKVTMHVAGEAKVYWFTFEETMYYVDKLYRLYRRMKKKMKAEGEWKDVLR